MHWSKTDTEIDFVLRSYYKYGAVILLQIVISFPDSRRDHRDLERLSLEAKGPRDPGSQLGHRLDTLLQSRGRGDETADGNPSWQLCLLRSTATHGNPFLLVLIKRICLNKCKQKVNM